MEVPFLKSMERIAPTFAFHHTAGTMFLDDGFIRALRLRAYRGRVPAEWRKFNPESWTAITDFVTRRNVQLIINLRHLGPTYDPDYFAFKEARMSSRLQFWDLNFDLPCRSNIRLRIRQLLSSHNMCDSLLDWRSLRDAAAADSPHEQDGVGINMHAGSTLKQWPYDKWRELCHELLNAGYRLKVFAGYYETERHAAERLASDLRHARRGTVSVIYPPGICEALTEMARLSCVVSVDSWVLHAAAGLGLNSVGLYITTAAWMWGGYSTASEIESPHIVRCENFDATLGGCRNGYQLCRLLKDEGDGIDVERVVAAIRVRVRASIIGHA